MVEEQYKLTYFNVKALAEPIRFIFAVAGVPFQDTRIEKELWPSLKDDYPWGQLPVLDFGDKRLAQSGAIARFLAHKFKLAGADEFEAARCDELVDAMGDLRQEWRKYFLEKDEDKKAELKKVLVNVHVKKYFKKFNSIQEANGGEFLVGSGVTWADLLFAHYFEVFEATVEPKILDDYPNLKQLKQAVFDLPQIKEWLEKRPNTPM